MNYREEAKLAYRRFRRQRGFLGITFNDEKLTSFKKTQKLEKAYNRLELGIKEVPLDDIVGSVGKYYDFDKNFIPKNSIIETRWCKIYEMQRNEESLPPVSLYKIKDKYFVYDGNHRISVAKSLSQSMIDAEVTEFLPSLDSEENALYKERFNFSRKYGIDTIELGNIGYYHLLEKSVEDFIKNIKKIYGNKEKDYVKIWYKKLYLPVTRVLGSNLPQYQDNQGDGFIHYLDHKYYLSEYHTFNVGYTYALLHFTNYLKYENNENSENNGNNGNNVVVQDINLSSNMVTRLREIYDFDQKIFYPEVFNRKIRLLEKEIKAEFKRENHLIGEVFLHCKLENLESYEVALKDWHKTKYPNYYTMVKEFGGVLGDEMFFLKANELAEDVVRYGREFRKKSGKLFNQEEITLRYILNIYLPIITAMKDLGEELNERAGIRTFALAKGSKREEELREARQELYLELSNKYLYYLRYNGEKNFIEFFKENLLSDYERSSILSSIGLSFRSNPPKIREFFEEVEDTLRVIVEEGEIDRIIEEFEETLADYGGSESYKTVSILKASVINYHQKKRQESYIEILRSDLKMLEETNETLINFQTKKTFNYLKGRWRDYTLIDYYASIITGRVTQINAYDSWDIMELARSYAQRDFKY